MTEKAKFAEEAKALGRLGQGSFLPEEIPQVCVVLSEEAASTASAAWSWTAQGDDEPESLEDRVVRHFAGSLALIGLAIEERGERLEDGQVQVLISIDLLVEARIGV